MCDAAAEQQSEKKHRNMGCHGPLLLYASYNWYDPAMYVGAPTSNSRQQHQQAAEGGKYSSSQ